MLILATIFLACLGLNSFPVVRMVEANPHGMPPEWVALSPKNNTAYSPDSINLSFIAEAVYPYDYYYTIDTPIVVTPIEGPAGLGKTIINTTLIPETPRTEISAPYTFQCNTELPGLSEGQHNLTLYCGYDALPGWRYEPAFATIVFYIDSSAPKILGLTPPKISVSSIQNKTYEITDIDLNFTVSEPVSQIAYSLDGQEKVTVAGNVTLTGLSDGWHNVTVYATGMDGYVGISETAHFKIETFPASLVIASVVIVIVVFAVFLLMARKHKR